MKYILPALISACSKDQNPASDSLVWMMNRQITHVEKCVTGITEIPSLVMLSCFACKCLYPAEISFLEKKKKSLSDRPDADASCLTPRELVLVEFEHEQGIRGEPRDQATPAELLSSLTSWKIRSLPAKERSLVGYAVCEQSVCQLCWLRGD